MLEIISYMGSILKVFTSKYSYLILKHEYLPAVLSIWIEVHGLGKEICYIGLSDISI